MPYNLLIYYDSKVWEISLFYLKSLGVGTLLIGSIYLLERFVFSRVNENTKEGFIVYILKSILYIFFVFLLSVIFGHIYLYLGILLIILFFLLSYYSIPIGISRIKEWWFYKNYRAHLETFAISKKKEEKWGEIKNNILKQITTTSYNYKLGKLIKPRIAILERIKKTDEDEKEFLLLMIEIWIKIDKINQKNTNFIEESISQNIETLSSDKYYDYKFHVEQF